MGAGSTLVHEKGVFTMPMPKKELVGRINLRCEGWFSDLVAETAARTERSMSAYIRHALVEQMRRDGVPADQLRGETAKPPGRPTAEPEAKGKGTKGKRSRGRKKEG
jgi:hypothetical protein